MSNRALFFALVAALCWGIGAIFEKQSLNYLSTNVAFVSRFYIGFILLLPFMVLTWGTNKAAILQAGWPAVVYVSGASVFALLGYYMYYWALSLSEASRAVPVTAVFPLVVFFLAMIFLREAFTISKLVGTVMVMGGVYFLSR